jgi:hypothetical protein
VVEFAARVTRRRATNAPDHAETRALSWPRRGPGSAVDREWHIWVPALGFAAHDVEGRMTVQRAHGGPAPPESAAMPAR